MTNARLSDCEPSLSEDSSTETEQSAVRQGRQKKQGNKKRGRKKQVIAERRSRRQMKEEPPSLIDVLARFEEDNPHSRKVLCNLLSGGSGGRTRNYERNCHNKAHTPHGWEGFDGIASDFLQERFAPSHGRNESNRQAFSSLESRDEDFENNDNENTETTNERDDGELCFIEQKKVINTISNNLICRQCVDDSVDDLEKLLKTVVPTEGYGDLRQRIMKFSKDCTNEVYCSVRHVGCATSFSWSFLDMLRNKFGKNSLPVVEDDVGKVIRESALI